MWQQDPFKAKWSIVARAYSSIRDQIGKSNAPLDAFLNLICPVIGIIGTEDYLEKMNWSVEFSSDSQLGLRQVSAPNFEVFGRHFIHTSMTERDVINFVASKGYITRQIANIITTSRPKQTGRTSGKCPYPQEGLLASRPTLQTLTPVTTDSVNRVPDQLSGSISDLYNPDAGYFDLGFTNDANTWGVSDIENSLGFEELFAGLVQDSYVATPYGK